MYVSEFAHLQLGTFRLTRLIMYDSITAFLQVQSEKAHAGCSPSLDMG
ncbi:DUF1360 domain-containing protein [Geobacillus sp. E263]